MIFLRHIHQGYSWTSRQYTPGFDAFGACDVLFVFFWFPGEDAFRLPRHNGTLCFWVDEVKPGFINRFCRSVHDAYVVWGGQQSVLYDSLYLCTVALSSRLGAWHGGWGFIVYVCISMLRNSVFRLPRCHRWLHRPDATGDYFMMTRITMSVNVKTVWLLLWMLKRSLHLQTDWYYQCY